MKKCEICRKKLDTIAAMIGKCRCENHFCTKHRLPDEHKCSYDFQKNAKIELMKNNPVIKAEKLVRI